MKKKKPSRKKIKPNKKEIHERNREEAPNTLVDFLAELKYQSRLKNPFGFLFNKPNPFQDTERAKTFSYLLMKIYNIALGCSQPILEFGEKGEREENIKILTKAIRDIPPILESLLPKKKRGDRILRYYKSNPELLLGIIHGLEQELRGPIASSYKGKIDKKKEDVKKFWEKRFKEPYPRDIYVDDRTLNTIALSILAYRNRSSYDRFKKLYYEEKKIT